MEECKPRIIVKLRGNDKLGVRHLRNYAKSNFHDPNIGRKSVLVEGLFSGNGKKLGAFSGLLEKLKEAKSISKSDISLPSYYAITIPEKSDLLSSKHEILKAPQLEKYIDHAYIESGFVDLPQPSVNADSSYPTQGYLESATDKGVGIAAITNDSLAQEIQSIHIKNKQAFVDVERGWVFKHEDLGLDEDIHHIFGKNSNFEPNRQHGTSSIGVVGSIKNNIGCNGLANISPQTIYDMYCSSTIRVKGSRKKCTFCDRYNAILEAILKIVDVSLSIASDNGDVIRTIERLSRDLKAGEEILTGSVLLIEEQGSYGTGSNTQWGIPVEYEQGTIHQGHPNTEFGGAIFELIRAANLLNIAVVEPAGNGGHDLDKLYQDMTNQQISSVPDSGAIVVAAGDYEYSQWEFSKWDDNTYTGSSKGSRADCFAWGSKVGTLSTKKQGNQFSKNKYRTDFKGTSSASAIIAGVALFTQTLSLVKTGKYLTSEKLREYMRDETVNWLENSDGKKIYMPDLKVIADKLV